MFSGGGVPQPDRVVPPTTPTGKRTAIRGVRRGKYPICVPLKGLLMFSSVGSSQPNREVTTPTGKCDPIWGVR